MKLLWNKDLRINTVHVEDVCSALLALAEAAMYSNAKSKVLGQTFNLADKGDTDQESLNDILSKIFGIQTGFQGTIISNLARVRYMSVVLLLLPHCDLFIIIHIQAVKA
jgi:hypothetical protein